jgi:hypothetical protein
MARASHETGLSDFGPDGWQEGLEQFVRAIAIDIGDNIEAAATLEDYALKTLVNRLRIEGWYTTHALETINEVEGPTFIVGLPRTGTTALHYLLAVDQQFRYLRRWEAADPVHSATLTMKKDDAANLTATTAPNVRHISTPDGPVEDGPILALHFHNQELGVPLPTYTLWWRQSDMAGTYVYHERVLRLLHSHRPPHRWLLKHPGNCFHLLDIARHYSGARFVMTHRDPVQAVVSVCSVVRYAQENAVPGFRCHPATLGRFLLDHWVEGVQCAFAARRTLGEDRFCDVDQSELEARPIEVVNRIYDFLGLDLSHAMRSKMERWADDNRRGSRGEHQYAPEEYGLSTSSVRRALRDYIDRFAELT